VIEIRKKINGVVVPVTDYVPRHGDVSWSGGMVPCILNFDTRQKRKISLPHSCLTPRGKSPFYSLGRKLDGPHTQFGRWGEDKITYIRGAVGFDGNSNPVVVFWVMTPTRLYGGVMTQKTVWIVIGYTYSYELCSSNHVYYMQVHCYRNVEP
jgi:hypothetical protein